MMGRSKSCDGKRVSVETTVWFTFGGLDGRSGRDPRSGRLRLTHGRVTTYYENHDLLNILRHCCSGLLDTDGYYRRRPFEVWVKEKSARAHVEREAAKYVKDGG